MIYCAKFGVEDYLAALYICFYTFSLLSMLSNSIRKEHAFKFPRLCERMSCEQSKKIVLQLQMFPKDHDGANCSYCTKNLKFALDS